MQIRVMFVTITDSFCKIKPDSVRGVLSNTPKIPEISVEIQIEGPTRIFGITSGGGPLISVEIFRPKLAVPFLTNWFFALMREFRKGMISGKSHSYWFPRFNRKITVVLFSSAISTDLRPVGLA